MTLPHLHERPFLADGGLETSIIFQQGIDLPDFAAFPLLDTTAGRRALTSYHRPYLEVARRTGTGIVLDTATWRASLDWGARLGYSPDEMTAVNRRSVDFIRDLAVEFADVPTVLNGAIGPRGDGYVAGDAMSVAEATAYHALQTRAFAEAGADMVSAVTMTNVPEAIGVVAAAVAAGLPVAVSFTVETDGVLPSGEPLGSAIEAVDEHTEGAAAYYMVNCAHPTHFDHVLDGGGWVSRIRGIRANASDASHEELDEAVELDRGDIDDLARRYARLQEVLPPLAVVGGCCGTDHEHIAAIADAVLTAPAR